MQSPNRVKQAAKLPEACSNRCAVGYLQSCFETGKDPKRRTSQQGDVDGVLPRDVQGRRLEQAMQLAEGDRRPGEGDSSDEGAQEGGSHVHAVPQRWVGQKGCGTGGHLRWWSISAGAFARTGQELDGLSQRVLVWGM